VRRWRGLDATPGDLGRTVVTIGMYDGVHRGHQALIGAALIIWSGVRASTFSPCSLAAAARPRRRRRFWQKRSPVRSRSLPLD